MRASSACASRAFARPQIRVPRARPTCDTRTITPETRTRAREGSAIWRALPNFQMGKRNGCGEGQRGKRSIALRISSATLSPSSVFNWRVIPQRVTNRLPLGTLAQIAGLTVSEEVLSIT